MDLKRSCREVTRLVLESEDRELTATERLALEMHWRICDTCRKFREQARLMRHAMARWRRYRDDERSDSP
ncbi:MAG TPA: zf-HC2 domain-containing protein [Burkholderiaceae bacterium]|nr:zf-HC2 domain-containing protein [Burkholderiaceae bacterium]